ncbi:LOW QUALITY PROTEIN: ubiquitin carboxyl-terminal hydrolase 5-like [Gigantopelta aegis]|uniref:LOW QUALITY PROTEIN: ubiquitin carboxyl-terminal hydrolase 5-like n=1 Tax=Gigantopelta aegis TaxID=1735272 RepID=UPI001B88CBB5|nr:LOW QUALITY PROTEIN: ubiquitin carboxyl-terminal hydrolase 5-like [Gigantopelta aegis]
MSAIDLLRQHLSKIKAPLGGEKVYKDECVYSFDNPESQDGLYVCMKTFLGFGRKHVHQHFEKTGNAVFLRIKRIRKEIPAEDLPPPAEKPTKLAIGVEGGFQVDEKKFKFEEQTSVVVLPDFVEVPLPNQDIPDIVQLSVQSILAAEDAWKLEEAAAMAGTWEGEKRQKSKHADNLLQLENRPKIPPSGWKCEQCELTSNLWLNLTDGTILCGRRFFDGSGGNNHAVEHFNHAKHPLAVKLGTITGDSADVYSYDEDEMVEDPLLAKHLAHFGINLAALEKTEKTMVELEIDLNQKIGEWDVIQEAGSKLKPLYGPGYTGMRNLGNSCYMNSVMQVLFTIPDFQKKYFDRKEAIFHNAPANCVQDFNVQMAKLGHGLLSGEYSQSPMETDKVIQPPSGIRPQMFKTLIGKGHPEFSTKRQQDSQEFFLHLINLTERNSKGSENPGECFRFQIEERLQCAGSGKVRYTSRPDFCLSLPVPVDKADNLEAVAAYEAKKKQLENNKETIDPKEIVRPRISLQSCIDAFMEVVSVDDFYSSALKSKTQAKQTTRLSTFPDFLMVQLKKFTVGYDWVPKKLDVSIDAPLELDISRLRGSGIQPGEEQLPQDQPAQQEQPAIQIDESTVKQLVDMGFARNGCCRAVFHTKNSGAEVALNWIMEHMGDPDFSDPFVLPSGTKSGEANFQPNEEALLNIMSMGFNKDQATKALKSTNNNVERAVDWIFSHADELEQPMETEEQSTETGRQAYRDGSGKYKLVAFISHMGTSTNVGHYVCHILKDGKWVIFNDEKVALSEHPPRDLAYLYLYQRV